SFIFFFSSRRRHTRFSRDWSSDVCSSDLNELTKEGMSLPELMLAYNRANRAVAVLCNHQRAVPKTFDKQMENLDAKIKEKTKQRSEERRVGKKSKMWGTSNN